MESGIDAGVQPVARESNLATVREGILRSNGSGPIGMPLS
jgi:hypothetical protein